MLLGILAYPDRMRRRTLLLAVLGTGLLAACQPRSPEALLSTLTPTVGLTVQRDLAYGQLPRQRLDVYRPAAGPRRPALLFIHGGSWQNGDKSGYGFVGESFARAGYLTVVMNYRLVPADPYPAYLQDAALALRWLREHAAELGAGSGIFVMGHSAGGFNAVEVVDNPRWLAEVGLDVGEIRGVIGLAGPYSYDYRDYPTRVAFPPGSDPEAVMPTGHLRAGAPPHLLLEAADDTVVHPQNGLRLETALRRQGAPVERVTLPGLNHFTIAGSLARPLTFLGRTRELILAFMERYSPPAQ